MSSSPPTSPAPFPERQQQTASAEEAQPAVVEARLAGGGKVLIDETRSQDELRTRGFGEREGQEYVLKPYEALYLLQAKRLVFASKKDVTFDSLFEHLLKHDRNIMTKFLVYRDLRSRGYVAKEGFGFGDDFRVYERGEYEKKPAKYVVFGINEGANVTARSFASAIEQIEKMGKEAVVAVIERRGEVIYYKASKMRFSQNKHDTFLVR
ncbi:tRNA-intron lyase [Nitrososphaera viennensis]|uniref:tRNA-intron lyase n=2 Tax=Nitrososphaera viennensis TaxID=1034015 RepID=A0A977IEW9_9ARCH|nr:tRNA-intron lyase [Nitrososphaera viennensis]AIC14546.1 putative tRNA-splicing endonuclease [Nitrososphaera viennensis EN76]UVS69517.1 tRNA-intron lyase [Nitrososphaera viennensis]